MRATSSVPEVPEVQVDGRPPGRRPVWRRALSVLLLAALPVVGVAGPAQAVVPTIGAVSPTVGVDGTSVRITGTGFATTAAGNTVTFGAVRATVTAASATALTVTVPAPRVSSKIRVRTAGGTTATRDFYLPPAPYTAAQVASRVRTTLGGPGVAVVHPSTGRVSLVLFDAQAGQRFAVDVAGSSIAGARLRVYRPEGTLVRSGAGIPVGSAFLDTVAAPVTGTYSVAVDSGTAGGATVSVRAVPADSTGTLARGTPATVTTTTAGQNAIRTFTGTAGQRVAVEYSALALTGTSFPEARILFVRPDGSKLGLERVPNQNEPTGLVDTVTLPVTGTYRVKVDPLSTATGSVRLLLHAVPADSTGALTINARQTVSTSAVGQNAWRSFAATAGDRFRLDVPEFTYDVARVRVVDPAGGIVVRDILVVPGGSTFLSDVWTVPVTGTYRVEVDPGEQSTGSLVLLVFPIPPDETGTLTPGVPSLVTVAVSGQSAHRTFTGSAGQTVVLDFTGNTITTAVLSLITPGGVNLLPEGILAGDHSSARVRLPQTGTYRLAVSPFRHGSAGTVTATLWVVPPDDVGTISVGGPAQTVSFRPAQRAARTFSIATARTITVRVTGNTLAGVTRMVVQGAGGEIPLGPVDTPVATTTAELPAGAYTLRIRPEHAESGSLVLELD